MKMNEWPRSARLTVALFAIAFGISSGARLVDELRPDLPPPQSESDVLIDAGVDAEAAARDVIVRMTTYDYRTVAEDFSWVDDAGTAAFEEYFAASRRDTVPVIRARKVVATGTVVDAAARVVDADHVDVLLFVDQEIEVAGDRKIDQPRVTMRMVREGGRWLADTVEVNDLLDGS